MTVLCLTETWLTRFDVVQIYLVTGYNSFRVKCREYHSGGGVIIQILDGFVLSEEIVIRIEESFAALLERKGNKFKIAVFYNAPRRNKRDFVDRFDCFLEKNSLRQLPFVTTADFNIDLLKTNLLIKNYENVLTQKGFEILLSKVTRIHDESATCLDQLFSRITKILLLK